MADILRAACEPLARLTGFPWGAVSALAATVGLFLTAWAIRQSTRTRELQIFRDLFKDILGLEKELLAAAQKQMDAVAFRGWFTTFCQTLEYFAFLWNHRLLKDRRLTGYFDTAVVHWFESVFLKHATEEEKTGGEPYPELKMLYKRLAGKKGKGS